MEGDGRCRRRRRASAGGRGAFQGFCATLDGTPKWWDVVVTPIGSSAGNVSALLAISRDVTRQKEAIDALHVAQTRMTEIRNQLAHVARLTMLGTVTASIAHELTQPLTAIMTNAQAARRLAAQPVPDVNQLTAALDDIVRDDQRAADIIDHFRTLLRQGGPSKELCDLKSTIEQTIALVRAEAVERRIVLNCEFDDAPLVWADRIQLEQLVLNLVMNALDAVGDIVPGDAPRHHPHASAARAERRGLGRERGGAGVGGSSQPDAGPVLHDEARGPRTRPGDLPGNPAGPSQ